MSVTISDTLTPEGKRFMKELQELAKLEVQIGFHREDDIKGAKREDGTIVDTKTNICDIAAWNEFGTTSKLGNKHIPARPFLKQSVENNRDEINQMLAEKKKEIMSGVSAEQVLKGIGAFQADLIQKEISEGSFKANKEYTIEKKGKKKTPVKPLIDTSRMLQSVHYKIKPRGT